MNNNTGGVKYRRQSALSRLEAQLVSGIKPYKGGVEGVKKPERGTIMMIQLGNEDRKRIQKEISILKERI